MPAAPLALVLSLSLAAAPLPRELPERQRFRENVSLGLAISAQVLAAAGIGFTIWGSSATPPPGGSLLIDSERATAARAQLTGGVALVGIGLSLLVLSVVLKLWPTDP